MGIILDCDSKPVDVSFHRFTGQIHIRNIKNASASIIIYLSSGRVTVDSSCTAGSIIIIGTGSLINNGQGVSVDERNLIYQAGGRAFGGM